MKNDELTYEVTNVNEIALILAHPKLGICTVGKIYTDLGEAFNGERLAKEICASWPGNRGTRDVKPPTEPKDSDGLSLSIYDRVEIVDPGVFLPSLKGMKGRIIGGDAYTIEVRMDIVTKEMQGFEDARTGVLCFESKDVRKL